MSSSGLYDFDVLVVGGGSAGYAAARTAAGAGLKTGVVEGGEEIGGLCILRGCMPTKALLYAAEILHLARHPEPWGIQPGKVVFDFPQVMARKDRLIKEFADYRTEQLTSGKFEFIRGHAAFEDEHTIRVDGQRKLRAKNFILATGSRIAKSPVPGVDERDCMTSDSALRLSRLPKSLIVLGGGAVAVEFAQFFTRFDVEVTLIQRSSHVLHEFDPEAAHVLETVLRREGMRVFTGTKLFSARHVGGLKQVAFSQADKNIEVQAEEIFFGLGRSANTEGLQLDRAGVKTAWGQIVTDERMRSSTPHIYAAGDCTGPYELVHLAVIQGEIAAHNIAYPERPRAIDYRLKAEVVFTDPQLAQVGLNEQEAQRSGIPYLAASYPFADHGKSLIMEAKDGFVKLLASPSTGEILGGCCVGPHGGELIHEIIAAMHKRMTVHELATMPHYHPTLAEIWTYPAEELADKITVGKPTGMP